jgi:ZIP family zinc transporter
MLLTLLAGLSTGIGGLITLFFKRTNTRFLSVSLGFSAGVMIYISFAEMLTDSKALLITKLGAKTGAWVSVAAFFGGIFLIAVIDKLIPSFENPHESHGRLECDQKSSENPLEGHSRAECDQYNRGKKLLRTGIVTATIIAVHNFPEGMATFVTSIHQPSLGMAVAAAIAIHNIPEGISVAIPVYCATGSRVKALWYTLVSGIGEPLGALLAYLVLMPILNDTVFGILFAAIAGIMVFISLDELLPTAREYGEHHLSIYGLIGGMIVMAVSLILLT